MELEWNSEHAFWQKVSLRFLFLLICEANSGSCRLKSFDALHGNE